MGGDIKSLQVEVAGKKGLPLPLVKRILLHTLRGLAHMHHCHIVHTDLKHDNIMFDTGSITQDDIAMFMKTDPARRHPPEESWECVVQAAVSQPLPLPSLSEAMTHTYIVSDFGSALHTTNEITANSLRAPEIILQGPWDNKVDIWAFGCLIFELIVGGSLFEYKSYPEYMLDEPTGHLWQMLCFTRERMTREQVNSSKLGAQYFDLTFKPNAIDNPFCLSFCDLKAHPPVFNNPFARSLRNYKVLQEADVLTTAKIMQRCLRLNPKDRATAEELLQDPWWHGAA
ncbi:kinase-like domain-containing protein [Amanita rubescens]|nr:kinase-like domain-containing protein [Amanita rubescens]